MKGCGHTPVLLEETLLFLQASRPGVYLDGTFGLGGHSLEILKRNSSARVIGFDRDEASLQTAAGRLKAYANRLSLYQADFRQLLELEGLIPWDEVRGALFDLGLSSFQLADPARGFSFNQEGPLDMRMDTRQKVTAEKNLIDLSGKPAGRIVQRIWRTSSVQAPRPENRQLEKLGLLKTTSDLRRVAEETYHWIPQKTACILQLKSSRL